MGVRRVWRWGAVLILLLALGGAFLAWVVNPVVFRYATAALDALTVQAVNTGVAAVVQVDTYSQLTDIRRDDRGVIMSVSANVNQMNQVAAAVSTAAQQSLAAYSQQGVAVPLGTFSGLPFLVGRGVPVALRVELVGAVNCRFDSAFVAAGINQTQHKIMLYADAVVDVILPLMTRRTQVAVQMLFADNIIVGQVPEFYWGA